MSVLVHQPVPNCTVLTIVGDLDADSVLDEAGSALRVTRCRTLVFDLHEVGRIDGRGFFALLAVALKARAAGKSVALLGRTPQVTRLVARTATGAFLPAYDSVHEALSAAPQSCCPAPGCARSRAE